MLVKFFEKLKPRYNLSLDSYSYDANKKKLIYCFKIFGDHSFIKLSYDEIKDSKDLIYSINPFDLILIAKNEESELYKNSKIKMVELLRDNKYKISDENAEHIYTGDEICDNQALMEKIDNLDLFRIAYNTGFNHGRVLEKIVRKKIDINKENSNILSIKYLSS